jgi:hypothetical protein
MTKEQQPVAHEMSPAQLRDNVVRLQEEMAQLKRAVQELFERYSTTCEQCGTVYDLLAHHYSVGLFDNVVYVKCPSCQKAVPVEGRRGEGFRLVKE